MKKASIILMIILAVVVSACAALTNASTPAGPTLTPGIVNTNYADALPVPAQLALGIIQLKDTTNAISVEEATALLPLWQALRTLSSSSTSSQVEINALIMQIQDSMKPAQLQAIADMKLTQSNVAQALQQAGVGPSFANGSGASGTPVARTPGAQFNNGGGGRGGGNFQGGSGGFVIQGGGPGGNFGGGGGFGGSGNGAFATPATQATIQAQAASRVNASNVILYAAVISFLQQMSGA